MIPSFYQAGFILNKPLTSSPAPCDYFIIAIAPASRRLTQQARRVGIDYTADGKTFAQMLAKIALGIAVAQFGVKGFKPTVQNLILNNPDEYGHWVGGFAGMEQPEYVTDRLHWVYLRSPKDNDDFIIVDICLFAEFGAPTNYVVVGRLS